MNKPLTMCKLPIGLKWSKTLGAAALLMGACFGIALSQSLPRSLGQFNEVQLSSSELGQLELQSGWPKDDPNTFLVSIKNNLKFPINCKGLSVEYKNNSTPMPVPLVPKLYIASSLIKQGSIKNLRKDKVKSYVLVCTCFKKGTNGACQDPLAKEN